MICARTSKNAAASGSTRGCRAIRRRCASRTTNSSTGGSGCHPRVAAPVGAAGGRRALASAPHVPGLPLGLLRPVPQQLPHLVQHVRRRNRPGLRQYRQGQTHAGTPERCRGNRLTPWDQPVSLPAYQPCGKPTCACAAAQQAAARACNRCSVSCAAPTPLPYVRYWTVPV